MRNIEIRVRNLVLAAAVALTVSACVVVPARGYYAGGGYYTGAVTIEPPAPQVEVYGAPPAAGLCVAGRLLELGGRPPRLGGRPLVGAARRDTAGRPIAGNTAVMAGT